MKILNLEGLTHYTEKLLDKIKVMLNDKADKNHVHDKTEQMYSYTIDLSDSSYDQNTYYPVVGDPLQRNGLVRIKLSVQLNSGTKPVWSTHETGFSCNLDLLALSSGWGTTKAETIVLDQSYAWTETNPCGYKQLINSSRPVLWLRGGGRYFVWSDYDTIWDIKISEHTISDEVVSPTTTYPGIITNKSTIIADLQGNATTANVANKAITANGSVFGIPNNGYENVEGGELEIANQDGTYWALDSFSNDFRIFDSIGNIHLTCEKGNPNNSCFYGKSNSATYASYLSGWSDTRHENTAPNDYNGKFYIKGLKINEAINSPDNSSFSSVLGFRSWADASGGQAHEFAFTGNGQMFQRHGDTDTWSSWNRFYTSENIGYGTSELTAGSSPLATGNFYFQYE